MPNNVGVCMYTYVRAGRRTGMYYSSMYVFVYCLFCCGHDR